MKMSESIIGGLFGLEVALYPGEERPPFLTGKELCLINGRCGIWLLINRLRPSRVWVPSYLCREGILEAINAAGTIPRFYEVDYDLKVRSHHWISNVGSGDLVIFIDYFGFPYDHRLAARVKENGAWVLEDACQALLSSTTGAYSDFVLFNMVKWIGVPDGAILRYPSGLPMGDLPLESAPAEWWLKALQASVIRREFDDGILTREWFKLFRETEDTMPTGPYAMSQLAQTVMNYSIDYACLAMKRRDNYAALLEKLEAYAIFPQLETGVVPVGFPVRVANRDAVRKALFDRRIYPPVHWHLDGVVPSAFEDSLRLSRNIITLPCDQRYGRDDMERMAESFLQVTRWNARVCRYGRSDSVHSEEIVSDCMGYAHYRYAESLREFGEPRELSHCGGWVLARSIPDTPYKDAMGCYPLFACRDWKKLHEDMEHFADLVSLTLVVDPFSGVAQSYLEQHFDLVKPFKTHYVADLSYALESFITSADRYKARKSLRIMDVEVCREPAKYLDDWMSLYSNLIMRHGIRGVRAFSRKSFELQLAAPGMVMVLGRCGEEIVGAMIILIHGQSAYSHLTAYSNKGYEMRAAYGMHWKALSFLQEQGIRYFNNGGGAGLTDDPHDGLAQFKRVWSNCRRTVYLCGRVFDREKYEALCQREQVADAGYFPAYRRGELVGHADERTIEHSSKCEGKGFI